MPKLQSRVTSIDLQDLDAIVRSEAADLGVTVSGYIRSIIRTYYGWPALEIPIPRIASDLRPDPKSVADAIRRDRMVTGRNSKAIKEEDK